ncbi:hypothetical protein GH714_031827 [Hevea brasiliensis]|uniref:Pentatricopeptide repeat-containing protein n=1 Tax=Hevea brasiliensis TaxID=3981 RepID=A0A6A6LFR1_HEVBR|nr:hypothetical protein GH714_031827 [Hevea brasiliensis]
MSAPIRAPAWVSTRRLFEQSLQDLHKCTKLNQIKEVHAQIIKRDLHRDLYVAPKLISAFSLCREMTLAVNVFNQIQDLNVHLYNNLIRAYVQNSQPSLAFAAFFDMQKNGVFADNFTYTFLLKACNGQAWLPLVQMMHSHVEKCGFFGDLFVPNSLIDSYSKCGLLGVNSAMKLFVTMDEKDIVSWNSMIGGLVKAGDLSAARTLFDEMPVRDTVSWNTILDGYAKAGEMNEAFELFNKMPGRNVVSWSSMVSGYSKAGDMEMAKLLFDKMPVKNVVPWTIIISGFAEKGLVKEAARLYDQMEATGLRPDDGTLQHTGCLCRVWFAWLGKRVHASIKMTRFKCSINVSNALVDMYAKCGSIDMALSVFNGMHKRDLVTWNCMLQGLAMHGHGEQALLLFSRMQEEGFKPDKVTLIGVLCACTHAEHANGAKCVIWGTLLGACRMHNAVELAEVVLDRLVTHEPSEPGNYSMLSNIFAAAGDWNSVANMRLQMKGTGVQKPSGASSIELDNEVHEFTVFDKSHPKSDTIYQMIDKLGHDLKKVGYVQQIDP